MMPNLGCNAGRPVGYMHAKYFCSKIKINTLGFASGCVTAFVYDCAVVKPRTLGRDVPGSSLNRVAVRCGLEQVTYPQLLR